jgi:hypothetical protein
MADDDLSTPGQEQEETGRPQARLAWTPGPGSVEAVKRRLEMVAAFAFLGKRSLMDGDYGKEGWAKHLSEIDCPFDLESLTEMAFEGLFKMACEAWRELFDPKDAVEGRLIYRIGKKEPEAD